MSDVKGRDGIMKLLLSSSPNQTAMDRIQKGIANSETDGDDSFRLSHYLHRSSGYTAKSNREEIPDDHTYVHIPNWRPDFVFAKPLRTLFVHPSDDSNDNEEEEVIDVESERPALPPVYDTAKATALMGECERHVNFQHPDEGNPDWEDHIPKMHWSNMQTRLFNKVVRVLHTDRLARLAHAGHTDEPVLVRLTVDRTARRMRQILASVAWHTRYTQWLHNLLVDNLHASYLVSYLDAVQTLKSKVPVLVDRMMAGSTTRSALAAPNHELLSIVHKRPWDPLSGGISRYKPRKLPKDPILVMVPSGPGSGSTSHSRTHHWMANLSALGTVVCVYSTPGRIVGKVSVATCMDHMLASTRAKVAELHADYGDKPIVLVGIGSGAALACQVALVENVTAVVCLGFPLYTAEGSRGTPDDALLNLQVPALFVVGQNASTCSVDDLEEVREKLSVVTAMVVVGGADDHLRLSKAKKKLDRVTQTMVDKCVMDEVADFLGTLLSPGYVPPVRPTVLHPLEPSAKRTVDRKRKIDMIQTGPDVLPPVPAKKGRKPKISMMQKIVHNKWASQISQVTAASSDLPRSPASVASTVVTTPTSQSVAVTGRVIDAKGLQFTTLQRSVAPALAPALAPAPSSESTITVVAASSPTLTAATAVKSRLAKGQLTSLSSLLQPGTRGVLSPGTRTAGGEEKLITVKGLAQSVNSAPDLAEELNILDMPVILGDQSVEEPILSQPQPQTSPVKFILTGTKPRPTVKLVGQSTGTKIFISKALDGGAGKALFVGAVEGATSRAKPRIRHIPATKHSKFI